MMEYCSSRLFVDGNPTKSMMALANEDFRIAGELMAMSIVQGGPGPYLFSSVVFNIISRDLKIDDCKNSFIKDTCQKVCLKHSTCFNCSCLIFIMVMCRSMYLKIQILTSSK
jgi:hypothetical protein